MQNIVGTSSNTGTELTHGRSPGVRYKKPPGWVYFIRSGDAIKIGYSLNVAYRLSTLQSGNPSLLELLGAVRGSPDDERRTQAMFIHLHIRGEWFREHPAILEYIAGNDRKRAQIRKHGSPLIIETMPEMAELSELTKREYCRKELGS